MLTWCWLVWWSTERKIHTENSSIFTTLLKLVENISQLDQGPTQTDWNFPERFDYLETIKFNMFHRLLRPEGSGNCGHHCPRICFFCFGLGPIKGTLNATTYKYISDQSFQTPDHRPVRVTAHLLPGREETIWFVKKKAELYFLWFIFGSNYLSTFFLDLFGLGLCIFMSCLQQ